MNHKYNIIVLIIADNDISKIEQSLESIQQQSFDQKRIKTIIVDNGSADSTYEILLKYSRTKDISLYRFSNKRPYTKILYFINSILKYLDYKYISILRPGDILYPDYIKTHAALMDKHATPGRGLVISEADITDKNNKTVHQTPVFSHDCILLTNRHYPYILAHGSGHYVQCFYSKDIILEPLSDLPFCTDFTDMFKMAVYGFKTDIIYIREPLSLINPVIHEDPVYDLILRLLLATKLNMIKSIRSSTVENNSTDTPVMDKINAQLCYLSLKYATDALYTKDYRVTKKALLFAEMLNHDIVNTEKYRLIKHALISNNTPKKREDNTSEPITVHPPPDSLLINNQVQNI